MTGPAMRVVEQGVESRAQCSHWRRAGQSIGFVPTMGALHAGHASLMQTARQQCDAVAVSIFVNPTQFGPREDLSRYPRPREADLELCREMGVDLVYYPTVEDVYPPGFATTVEVAGLSSLWEGASRPGHFRGVTTVVAKLFGLVPADRAYFGQKDYQQHTIIRRMVADLNLPVEIVVCPTVRDADGLALSSRNAYLTADQRLAALALSRGLRAAAEAMAHGAGHIERVTSAMREPLINTPGVELDYAVLVDPDTLVEQSTWAPRMTALIAAKVGTTRLIDNAILELRT